LTPLAHMVLCFQGIGDFQTRKATIIGGQPALRQLGLSPLHLERRDGLALVNGTSAMTGVALINADLTERAIAWSLVLTAAMAEVLGGRIEAWHAAFSSLRPHRRQAEVADCLCASVRDSERVTRQHLASRRMADVGQMTEAEAGQDAYTLRCAPQVIGAVWDTLDWHNQITLTELNAVTDNPIFPEGIEQVSALHGGNFMGQHVGLASDALGNGICVLAGLADSLRN
jgi:tyrosine ammonia-lyase